MTDRDRITQLSIDIAAELSVGAFSDESTPLVYEVVRATINRMVAAGFRSREHCPDSEVLRCDDC
jgi:hypothetical protein